MDIIQAYLSAWNHHDSKAIETSFLEDGVYIDANLDAEIPASVFALRAQELFNSFPALKVTLSEPVPSGDGLFAVKWTLSGALPDKELNGVDMICIRDNKIQSVQVYFDYKTGLIFSKVPSLHLTYSSFSTPVESSEDESHISLKYRTSGLTSGEVDHIKDQLQTLMESKQLYLRQDLSLAYLANALDVSTNHLSQVINSQFGCHFYDFVNGYRIAHCQTLLKDTGTSQKALSLAMDSGFRSTSTFYTAFKKVTGCTLTEYKQRSSA